MAKATFYSVLFTLFMWYGGLLSVGTNVANDSPTQPSSAIAQAGDSHAVSGEAHEAAAEVLDHADATGQSAAGHEADAGHGEAEVGLLDVTMGPFLWQLILFLILLTILGKFVWPPILNGLREREGKIHGDLKHAEDAAKQATKTLEEYKQQLADAQKQAQQIIDQSRGDALKVGAQLKEQAQADINSAKQRAEADINSAKERAVSEIYEQTATLATQVAGQILRREINAQDQEALVKESLSRLNEAQKN